MLYPFIFLFTIRHFLFENFEISPVFAEAPVPIPAKRIFRQGYAVEQDFSVIKHYCHPLPGFRPCRSELKHQYILMNNYGLGIISPA